MKRDARLAKLSWDHHHGLVMALRISRELPEATDEQASTLYSDLLSFWAAGLLPHFRVEQECLLARLVGYVGVDSAAVRRTTEDHLEMEALVTTMRDASNIGQRRAALARFGENLKTHIRWEEAVLFELTQDRLAEAELDALGADIEAAIPEVQPAPSNWQ